ncbi:hypothetical protein ACSQ67_000922 [Phaseolus vulgaris]
MMNSIQMSCRMCSIPLFTHQISASVPIISSQNDKERTIFQSIECGARDNVVLWTMEMRLRRQLQKKLITRKVNSKLDEEGNDDVLKM